MQRGTGKPGSLQLAGMSSLMQDSPFSETKLSCKGAEQLMSCGYTTEVAPKPDTVLTALHRRSSCKEKQSEAFAFPTRKQGLWQCLDRTFSLVK